MKMPSAIVERFGSTTALNLAFAGVTGAMCLIAWLGFSKLQRELTEVERIAAERNSLLEHREELQGSFRKLTEQIIALQQTVQTWRAKLPETPEESQFLHHLSERADATGISLGDFRPGGIVNRTHCKEIELRLRGTGPYASLCRWLARLDDLPRIVRVSQLTITGPATPGGDCTIDLQLGLAFGFVADQQLAGGVKP